MVERSLLSRPVGENSGGREVNLCGGGSEGRREGVRTRSASNERRADREREGRPTYELELILVGARSESEDLRVVVEAHAGDGRGEVADGLEGFPLLARFGNGRGRVVEVDDTGGRAVDEQERSAIRASLERIERSKLTRRRCTCPCHPSRDRKLQILHHPSTS